MTAQESHVRIFDADNHFYETRDALTSHLPPEFQDVIRYVDIDGQTKIMVDNVVSEYIPNPAFDRVGRPGAQEDYFRHGNPTGKSHRAILGKGIEPPVSYREAVPRLGLLDELGIDQTIMHPTLASLVEERLKHRPDATAAVVHSLNEWMVEHWPFAYENRIFSTPVITPGLVEEAVREVEFVASHGARIVLMRPAPAWGWRGPRSFALPEFDPLWQAITDADITVMFHASDCGYTRYENEWLGSTIEKRIFDAPVPFRLAIKHDCRPIQDAVTSLVCEQTLVRFPRLRFLCVENGAEWVPGLLRRLDYVYKLIPQEFAERPSDTVRRHFWVAPFHEEDPTPIIELLGEDRVIFGSDYPHVEGMSDPKSYVGRLEKFGAAVTRKVMGENLRQIVTAGVSG